MPTDGKILLAAYKVQDAQLVKRGFHKTSLPWMRALSRFWLSGKTSLTVRKGRQAGGSTTMTRIAVVTGLHGQHRMGPGARLGIVFVSVRMQEANERLANIEEILSALSVPFTRSGDTIELTDRPLYFRVLPCSYRGVVGGTYVVVFEDEVARWWSDEQNANPAVDVDASLVPGLATQPNGRIYRISSPRGLEDFHAELMARGETADQCVASGPSWFWNPTITEAGTHALQANPRRWRMEFLAEPQAGALGAFEAEDIDRAIGRVVDADLTDKNVGKSVCIIDPSGGKKDTFAFGIVRQVLDRNGRTLIQFQLVDGINSGAGLDGEQIVRRIAAVAHSYKCKDVHSDPYNAMGLSVLFRQLKLDYGIHNWTATSKMGLSKSGAVEKVRSWLVDDLLVLPEHEGLRNELLRFEEKISSNGELTYSGRRSAHDDFVALLVTCAMVNLPPVGSAQMGPHERAMYDRGGVVQGYSGSEAFYGNDYPLPGSHREDGPTGYHGMQGRDLVSAIVPHIQGL